MIKLIADWGVHSPRLDRLLAAECSHCDGSLGRLVRHDARVRGTQVWLACCRPLMRWKPDEVAYPRRRRRVLVLRPSLIPRPLRPTGVTRAYRLECIDVLSDAPRAGR
jgi:hypothetical protein